MREAAGLWGNKKVIEAKKSLKSTAAALKNGSFAAGSRCAGTARRPDLAPISCELAKQEARRQIRARLAREQREKITVGVLYN